MPFGLNARQQNAWMYHGGGMKLLQRVLRQLQHRRASRAATPARRWAAGSARRSRPSPTCKGLKMRIGGIRRPGACSKLGVVPQQIAGGDIYPALEKGTIDAAEWVGPYDDEKLGFYKVAQVLLLPRLVGRRPDARTPSSTSKASTRCRKSYQAIADAAAQATRHAGCRRATTRRTRPRSSAWWPAARSCVRSPATIMDACLKAHATSCTREIVGEERRRSRRSIDD
ncbi:MAG: hypothetical protein MZV49_10565 [Rhodopseudomonas palustris]|nr:hypothetical protein [Rhodopseudomonas palustris]